MMNTRNFSTPVLEKGKKYVFCNEDLEPAFEQTEIDNITEKWNDGYSFEEIAEDHSRDPDEIFLAVFHQAREGKITRKLFYSKPNVKHLKTEFDIPTVIEYEGRKYVHDEKSEAN